MHTSKILIHSQNLAAWNRYYTALHNTQKEILIHHYHIQNDTDILIQSKIIRSHDGLVVVGSAPNPKHPYIHITSSHGVPIQEVDSEHIQIICDGNSLHVESISKGGRTYTRENNTPSYLFFQEKKQIATGQKIYIHNDHYLCWEPHKPKEVPPFIPLVCSNMSSADIPAVLDTHSQLIWFFSNIPNPLFRLPSTTELFSFLRTPQQNLPFQRKDARIAGFDSLPVMGGQELFLQQPQYNNWCSRYRSAPIRHHLLCSDAFALQNQSSIQLYSDLPDLRKKLLPLGFDIFLNPHPLIPIDEDVLLSMRAQLHKQEHTPQEEIPPSLLHYLTHVENLRNNYPIQSEHSLYDPHQGSWHLALQDAPHNYVSLPLRKNAYSRDPRHEIHAQSAIAIDFGTSNTVVARKTMGTTELVSIANFHPSTDKWPFENPTVLSFRNHSFLDTWQHVEQRPLVFWREVACAHDAEEEKRNCHSIHDIHRLPSILSMLKTWALQQIINPAAAQIPIHDAQGQDLFIKLHTEEAQHTHTNTIDPIELYAWQLGLSINNPSNGVSLSYCLSFPITFPLEVCQQIRASFHKGLFRSLPESVAFDEQYAARFRVDIGEAEPIAFSAFALQSTHIEPTETGTAFAIFDVGGGTTDFSFGLWKKGNPETDFAYDTILEHLYTSGLLYLGGELLLHELAYLVFVRNIRLFVSFEIPFILPIAQKAHTKALHLLNEGFEAQINTQILKNKLRGFMEGSETLDSGDSLSIAFVDIHRKEKDLQIMISVEELETMLRDKFQYAVECFIHGLANVFGPLGKDTIHIFLAGNGSKSRFLREFMNEEVINNMIQDYFGAAPHLRMHILEDCKTGTALGQLLLQKGSHIKSIIHETPHFSYYIGLLEGTEVRLAFLKNEGFDTEKKEWKPIAKIRDGIATIVWTDLDKAYTTQGFQELLDDGRICQQEIHIGQPYPKTILYARAIGPSTLALARTEDGSDPEDRDCIGHLEIKHNHITWIHGE